MSCGGVNLHTSSHICSSEARACKHCTPDAARNTPIDNPPGNPDPWRAPVHALVWALTTGSCRPGCRVQSSLLERRHSGAPTRLPGCDGLNSQLERGLPPKRAPWSLPRHLPPSCAHRAAPWAQRRPQAAGIPPRWSSGPCPACHQRRAGCVRLRRAPARTPTSGTLEAVHQSPAACRPSAVHERTIEARWHALARALSVRRQPQARSRSSKCNGHAAPMASQSVHILALLAGLAMPRQWNVMTLSAACSSDQACQVSSTTASRSDATSHTGMRLLNCIAKYNC